MEFNQGDFSVLMAVYYKEKESYLQEALNSIIEQSLVPKEIVLVKDGPLTAELESVISKMVGDFPIIKVLSLPENKGLAHALNRGLEICSFDIVARMDSDDISDPKRFETQFNFLIRNSEVGVVGTNIAEFEGEVFNIICERKVPKSDGEIKKRGYLLSPVNHATVMFRKETFTLIGGYNETVFPEDYYVWLKMFKKNIIFHNIQEPLYLVRADNGVIDRRRGLKYLKMELKFFNLAYKEGLLPLKYYLINVIGRSGFRLLPKRLLTRSYFLFFRKGV